MQSLSVCHISKITKLYKSTVSRIIIRYSNRGHTKNNKNTGRTKKVNQKRKKIVFQASKETLSQTLPKFKKFPTKRPMNQLCQEDYDQI